MTINPKHFPESGNKLSGVWAINDTKDSMEITYVAKPSLVYLPIHESKEQIRCQDEVEQLQNTLNKLIKTHNLNSREEIYQKTDSLRYETLSTEKKAALSATTAILQELSNELYPMHSVNEYASWVLRLLVNHLENGAVLEDQKVGQLYSDLFLSTDLSVHPRSEDDSNNPSFLLKNKDLQTKGIFKIAKSPMEASHQRVIKDLDLYQVQTRELLGYESDAILGFQRVPRTMKSILKNENQEEKIATFQNYIPQITSISDLYDQKDTGTRLKNLDKGDVQLTAISTIIKGLAAEHIGNCALGSDNRLYQVDLKECFIPFNKMPQEMKVLRRNVDDLDVLKETLEKDLKTLSNLDADYDLIVRKTKELDTLKQRLVTERKTIVMARSCILGLPQCSKPFDKAALMTLCHPSLQALMEAHHKNILSKNYALEKSALEAQQERLTQLQKLAQSELEAEKITLTPQKAFFALFGGSELYDLAITKGYHPLQIFNNIVGSAYRPEFEDLSKPETMKGRDNSKPVNDSETAKIVFENIQTLYSK